MKKPKPTDSTTIQEGYVIAKILAKRLSRDFEIRYNAALGDQWDVFNDRGHHCGGFTKDSSPVWYRVAARLQPWRNGKIECTPQQEHLVKVAIASVLENVNSLAA